MTLPAVRPAEPVEIPAFRPILAVAFFLSGAAALADESLWVRGLGLVFGTVAPAISATLALFLGGLGLGAVVFGRVADRVVSPLRLLAFLEIGAAALVALSPAAFHLAGRCVALGGEAPGPFAWFAVRFAAGAAILLPPTMLMGGTLPAIARWFVRREEHVAADVGRLYAWNTVGGAVGALLAAHLLIEHLGPTRGLHASAALHAAVGCAFLFLAGRTGEGDGVAREESSAAEGPPNRRVLAAAFVTGFSALALEACWTRLLALVLGSSAYAFASILAVMLIGLALGGWLIPRWAGTRVTGWLAASAVSAAALIFLSHPLLDDLPEYYVRAFPLFQTSFAGLTLLGLGIAAIGVLLPAAAMGGTFPLLVHLSGERVAGLGGRLGRVYGWNTLGAILGAPLATYALVPTIGLERVVGLCAALYLGVGLAALVPRPARRGGRAATLGVVGAVAGALIAWNMPDWDTERLMSGPFVYARDYLRKSVVPGADRVELLRERMVKGDLVFFRAGPTASVSVRKEGSILSLRINGKTDASNGGDLTTQLLLGHLPALLHSRPRNALVVGLGSGITLGAVLRHPVEHADLVEISSEVVEASRVFSEDNHRALDDPRVRLVLNDGRNFLLATRRRYDLITSQPTNPWITGSGNLFTREYYALCRARLAPGGVMTQWLQIYNIRPDDVWAAIRAFRQVFPHVQMFGTMSGGDLFLLGTEAPLPLDENQIERRVAWPAVREDLARVSLERATRILGSFLADEPTIDALIGSGPAHTDENPVLEFAAARALQRDTTRENFAWLAAIPRRDPLRQLYAEGRLALVSGDPIRAAALWEQALARDPGFLRLRWQVANAWYEGGRYYSAKADPRAEAAFRKAIAINSEHFAAFTDLGMWYLKIGRRQDAEAAFRAALRIFPTHAPALRALAMMRVVP